jgi:hypothetical protein
MAAGGQSHIQVLKEVNKGNKRYNRGNSKNAEDAHLAKFEHGEYKPPEFKAPICSSFGACYKFPTSYRNKKTWHGTCHTPANALAGAAMDCTCVLQPKPNDLITKKHEV